MGLGDFLSNLFGDRQLQPQRIDVRTPEMMGVQQRMAQDYSNASADPNYGVGTPEQQRLQESQLADSIRDRTGASGAGGSGFESDQIRKGVTDFRIGLLAKRQQYLDNLRGSLVQSSQTPMQTQPADIQTGIGRSALNTMTGTIASRAGNAFSNDLFGADPNATAATQQSQQSGGAPGTTGYRQNGGMKVT